MNLGLSVTRPSAMDGTRIIQSFSVFQAYTERTFSTVGDFNQEHQT
jgi:hypothetical protein